VDKVRVYAVVGPTASGKSSLAMALAMRHGGELICCDSMQVYRRMDIGTAKPTAEDRQLVVHHMVDIAEPTESYSCADYVAAATEIIHDVHDRGKLPILVGGTGLYLDALLRGGQLHEGTPDPTIRQKWERYAEEHGRDALHEVLWRVDPETAQAVHKNNVKRVIRALEIFETSGVPKSELDRRTREQDSPFDAKVIALSYPDRSVLLDRIDRRVDQMMADGLLAETEALYAEGVFAVNATAAQAIGYKELLGYLRGESTLEDCVAQLKTATHQYAKRQMTWFRSHGNVQWIDTLCKDRTKTFEEIVNNAEQLFSLA